MCFYYIIIIGKKGGICQNFSPFSQPPRRPHMERGPHSVSVPHRKSTREGRICLGKRTQQEAFTYGRRTEGLVERGRHLSDLSAQFPGFERRRHRRPAWHHAPHPVSQEARRRCHLALPDLPVAQRRQRLRHLRLPRHHEGLRHDGRLRHAAEDGGHFPRQPGG